MKRKLARLFATCAVLVATVAMGAASLTFAGAASANPGYWHDHDGWHMSQWHACQAYYDPPLIPWGQGCARDHSGFGYVDFNPGYWHPGAHWVSGHEIWLPCEPCRIGLPCHQRAAWHQPPPHWLPPVGYHDPNVVTVNVPGVYVGIG